MLDGARGPLRLGGVAPAQVHKRNAGIFLMAVRGACGRGGVTRTDAVDFDLLNMQKGHTAQVCPF